MKLIHLLFLAMLALVGLVAGGPDFVPDGIAPLSPPPSGCVLSKPGVFELSIENLPSKVKRQYSEDERNALRITLNNGIMHDSFGRTGSIVANYQFQFDGPAQAGAIYTGGFSFCQNGTIALGGSTVFWQCLSGTFYNLYDRWWAAQCRPMHLLYHEVSNSRKYLPSTSVDFLSSSAPVASGTRTTFLGTSTPASNFSSSATSLQGKNANATSAPSTSTALAPSSSKPPTSSTSPGKTSANVAVSTGSVFPVAVAVLAAVAAFI